MSSRNCMLVRVARETQAYLRKNGEAGWVDNRKYPIRNEQGEIVNWRYMMQEATKDDLLNRDNSMDRLLGSLAGSIYDKATAGEVNAMAIKAAHEQYRAEKKDHPQRFVMVGANSTDAELRDLWRMLSDDTQEAIRSIWGGDAMWVRRDTLDPLSNSGRVVG